MLKIFSPRFESPVEKTAYDEIKDQIERCCNDILDKPDWGANIHCCDMISASPSQAVLNESIAIVKKKINSSSKVVVILSLHLVEAVVKNCGARAHLAVNDESFMKDLGKICRKFRNKSDSSSIIISELSLDIVQAWGEAFLPRAKNYPNIVNTYHELRKENLPFKHQYDESRVPVFTPPPFIPDDTTNSSVNAVVPNDEDAALAAAIAASLATTDSAIYEPKAPATRRRSSSRGRSRQGPGPLEEDPSPSKASHHSVDVLSSCSASCVILKEIILAARSSQELLSSDHGIALEVSNSLKTSQSNLALLIEQAVCGEVQNIDVDELLKLNDEVGLLLGVMADMKRGHLSIADAQRKLQLGGGQELSSTQAHRQADLVGLFDVTPASTNVAQNSNANAKAKAKVEVDIFGDPIRPPPGSSTSPPFPPPAEERGGGPVSAGPHSSSFSSMFTARRPSSSSAPVGDTIMGIHHVMSHSQYPDNADNRTASATASNYPNAEVVRHSEPPTRIDFFQVSEISNTAAKPSTGTSQTSPFEDSTSCSIDMIFGSGSNNNFSAPAPPLTSAGNGAFGWPQFSQAPQQLIQPVQPVVSCNPFDAIPLNYNSTGMPLQPSHSHNAYASPLAMGSVAYPTGQQQFYPPAPHGQQNFSGGTSSQQPNFL